MSSRRVLFAFAGMFVGRLDALHVHGDEPAPLRPVPFTQVKLDDEFWAPRIRTCIEKTIPHNFKMCEETGRIRNWEKAARALRLEENPGEFEGYFFNDSDVYKAMEAAAYAIAIDPKAKYGDKLLSDYLDELIAKIAAMQWPDGYVNSYFALKKATEPRWTDIEHKHELYCAGHLIEAAIAHHQITAKNNFLDVAIRLADHVGETFGPGKNMNPCGHPEIELALCRLASLLAADVRTEGLPPGESRSNDAVSPFDPRVARINKYATLAEFFVRQHGSREGRAKLWGDYALDDLALVSRREISGHAVRAMYLLSGATDLARLPSGDRSYNEALDAIWSDLTQRKMYITGGIGPSGHNEGFTVPYDLPNDTAYAETCAAIGLVFWSHRMNLLHADAQYFDVLERALYNGVLAGVSLDGEKFNYTNPLASRGDHHRVPWFACACCPPNVARLLPTIGGYQYAQADNAVYVNLYATSTATVELKDHRHVTIKQETRYPWDGHVHLKVEPPGIPGFKLMLRVPQWCAKGSIAVDWSAVMAFAAAPGYFSLDFPPGTNGEVDIDLPMPTQRVHADPHVKADVGRVALQRGPIVYCLEGADNGGKVRNVVLPKEASLSFDFRPDLLRGVGVIRGRVSEAQNTARDGESNPIYTLLPKEFVAVPYAFWDNREPGEMIVWLPESAEFLENPPLPGVTPSASHCWDSDTVAALCDRQEPAESNDHSIPRFTWWPRKAGEEWVQYDFDKPRRVTNVEVYWFDDTKSGGGCRVPASWKLQYRAGDDWRDVTGLPTGRYGVALDKFNRVDFDPVTAAALRIAVQLADGYSGGILEWRVDSR